jgi:starch synthase
LKILFATSELAPLAKSGGLGDVAGALPQSLVKLGHEVKVIMPLYKVIKSKYEDQLKFVRWSMIKLGWRTMYSGLLTMDFNGVQIYFIDNEYYFGHDQLYIEYSFDIERFSFFQLAVLDAMGEPMSFEPDILHLNDWQCGMIPCLLDANYKPYGKHENVRTVFTIHNLKYQGIHGRERILDLLDIPDRYLTENGVLKDGVPNYMKSALVYADRITTVSPTYAREILTDYYGEGLNGVLSEQNWKLSGILNGIDTDAYDPVSDKELTANYSVDNWRDGKAACKSALQSELGLPQKPDTPMAAMITRLVDQKGLDLLLHILDELLEEDIQFVLLGTGNPYYEEVLRQAAEKKPEKMAARLTFNLPLSNRIYAAADMFLMPSLFEPCGLSQLISMRYGTIPVVRETGGLVDTVLPYNQYDGTGTGFSFANINAHEFLFTTKYACEVYRETPEAWQEMVVRAMSGDYSWSRSAQKYADLYEDLIRANT